MVYKFSKFLIVKENVESIEIFSTKNNSRIILKEDKYKEQYRNYNCIENITEVDVQSSEFLRASKQLGMLIHETDDELKELNYIEQSLNNLLHIVIMPTENCNFRCEYCYQNFPNKTLNEEEIETIVNFINLEIKCKKITKLKINWFGGEPLLCIEKILEMSEKILDVVRKNKIEYEASITTNGYLLNKVNFDALLEVHVNSFQITVDGSTHDVKRKLINGKGTFSVIMDNLIRISQGNYEGINIIIRHNIDRLSFDMNFYDFLSQYFKEDSRYFVYINPIGKFGGKNDRSYSVLEKMVEIKKYIKEHKDYARQVGLNVLKNSNEALSNICYASYPHSYVFRPNGDIARCTVYLDDPINIIGNFSNGKVEIFEEVKNKWISDCLDNECKKCAFLPTCFNKSCRITTLRHNYKNCPKPLFNN